MLHAPREHPLCVLEDLRCVPGIGRPVHDLGGVGAQDCGKQGGGNESPPILANEALQEIASRGNYYAEPQPSSLTGIFLAISADLGRGTSRLNG